MYIEIFNSKQESRDFVRVLYLYHGNVIAASASLRYFVRKKSIRSIRSIVSATRRGSIAIRQSF